jgi:hypothetical protein
MEKCIVEGCNKNKYHSKYYCSMHYRRLKFTGTLEPGKRSPAPLIERFWRSVDKKSNDECWQWIASINNKKYGILGAGGKGGKSLFAHRYSYELHNGKIPDGMFVMHKCDNPSCVNPNHLLVGTPKDNTQDALSKNRLKTIFLNGENHPNCKLSINDVKYIKSHNEIKSIELANMFNVSPQTICDIRKNRKWRNVK